MGSILHTLLSFLASQNALSAGGGGGLVDDRLEDALEAWHDGRAEAAGFTNEWVVRMDGDADEVDLLALKLGFKNLGELRGFPSYFLLKKLDHPEDAVVESRMSTDTLIQEIRVLWAQQLFSKSRVKRGHWELSRPVEAEVAAEAEDLLRWPELRQILGARAAADDSNEERGIPSNLLALWLEEDDKARRQGALKKAQKAFFNDLLWDHQWYMQDTRTSANLPQLDLNVLPVFDLGYSGKGVRVCVLDDGIEHTHDDLKANYDASISYDFNNGTEGDPDPSPLYPADDSSAPNSHGTRCAGEIAMVANNYVCGVGIAYGARIGGIRMLDGAINDRVEGLALQHALDKIDIFTASWGPRDDGKTVEGPGHLATKALLKGIKTGRDGKGAIYVWASGNGGMYKDNCNCDGYTSSIYTISIGSASEQGDFPWYGERCASTMSSTYSSGAYSDQKIATTDTNNTCTVSHTGTSAAAPLAAGIIALALEANPSLTWRDVQHLIVYTASPRMLMANSGWQVNGAGLPFSTKFGFGIIDALALVKAALAWKTSPEKSTIAVKPTTSSNSSLRSQDAVTVEYDVTPEAAKGMDRLEHVQVTVNIDYPVRGALEVVLVSPAGTLSQLLTRRPEDTSDAGFKNWTFMSVHYWGESPIGVWKLHVIDRETSALSGCVGKTTLSLHGTEDSEDLRVAAAEISKGKSIQDSDVEE